ncbi:MAG: right-handed parallel beta-helix repeat-containing protein, partial [Candidatus Lokiarchaeota archaeon]|nr:right-handed parallel beta-helix repeat-containing protein [Candidatus Lokiarchaeota archaeon]
MYKYKKTSSKKIGYYYGILHKKKLKIVFFGVLFLTMIMIQVVEISETDLPKKRTAEELKSSDFWTFTNPILINDSGVNHWGWAVSQEWCSGYGNSTHPYIIENLTINGNRLGSCIEIRNSNAYFVIRNCTLFNSSSGSYPYFDAGICLYNTSNGRIINNNCSGNYGNGITLYEYSSNNTISGC